MFRIFCLTPKLELTNVVRVARASIRPHIKQHKASNNILYAAPCL